MIAELKLERVKEEYKQKDERGMPMSIRERYWRKIDKLKKKLREKAHEKKLGRVLCERKLMDDDQLKEALSEQAENSKDKLIGEVLVEKGLITVEQLKEALRDQLEENEASITHG